MEHVIFKSRTATDFKLNLNLDILAKRADGYHGIDSLFLRLTGGDYLELQVSLPLERELVESDYTARYSLQQLLMYTNLLSNWELSAAAYACYTTGADTDLLTFLNRNKEKNLVYKSAAYVLSYWQMALLKRLFQFNAAIMNKISAKLNWSLNQEIIGKLVYKLQDFTLEKLLKCIKDFISFRWQFHLEKNIPAQAGLGAGSHDAAAVWRLIFAFLQKHWALDLTYDDFVAVFEAADIAENIGADTVFALRRSCALARVRGIGEEISELALNSDNVAAAKLYFIIVQPEWKVDTKSAYEAYDKLNLPLPPSETEACIAAVGKMQYGELAHRAYNHFGMLLSKNKTEYRNLMSYLKAVTFAEYVNLTGSGSACFLLYGNSRQRDKDYLYLLNNLKNYDKMFKAESAGLQFI